jgi:hypothetical protein
VDEGIEVTAKNGEVIPVQPFYTIEGNKIDVYVGKKRIKDYLKVLTKELADKGDNIANYTIEKHTDIQNQGYPSLQFFQRK